MADQWAGARNRTGAHTQPGMSGAQHFRGRKGGGTKGEGYNLKRFSVFIDRSLTVVTFSSKASLLIAFILSK